MEEILIAGGKGRLSVSGAGFLHLLWTPGSQVNLDDAMKSIDKMQCLSDGRALPLLVEISDVSMSSAARDVFERAKAVSAVAIVGSTVVDKVVSAYMGRHDFCPHAYFTSRGEALDWLDSLASP
ncbi:MAG: STAS/SEC14 domain-containing protein [Acidobacteria bacterium]|nr:STAS/SEC14 domain-containing protein [Acidobacteriota bacterium]